MSRQEATLADSFARGSAPVRMHQSAGMVYSALSPTGSGLALMGDGRADADTDNPRARRAKSPSPTGRALGCGRPLVPAEFSWSGAAQVRWRARRLSRP
jgi:hypothetical protein